MTAQSQLGFSSMSISYVDGSIHFTLYQICLFAWLKPFPHSMFEYCCPPRHNAHNGLTSSACCYLHWSLRCIVSTIQVPVFLPVVIPSAASQAHCSLHYRATHVCFNNILWKPLKPLADKARERESLETVISSVIKPAEGKQKSPLPVPCAAVW